MPASEFAISVSHFGNPATILSLPCRRRELPMSHPEEQNEPLRRLLVQDASRRVDVEAKQKQIRDLLIRANADAVLLQDPANIAWFTSAWFSDTLPILLVSKRLLREVLFTGGFKFGFLSV